MTDSKTAVPAVRNPLASFFGFDPFADVFRSFSPVAAALGVAINRTETGYTVEIPVPGFTPEQIDVTFENGVLTVAASSEKRRFTRALLVPEEIDADAIEARVEHGLLTLTLTRTPAAAPKKIAVQAAG